MENFGFVYNVEPTDDSAPALCVPACPYHNSVTFTNTLSACTGCMCSACIYSVCCIDPLKDTHTHTETRTLFTHMPYDLLSRTVPPFFLSMSVYNGLTLRPCFASFLPCVFPGTDSSTVSPSDTCGSCAAFSTCVSGTGSGPPYQQLSTIPWVVATSNNGCPQYTYATRPLVGRCWPSEDFYVNSSVSQAAQISASYAGVANGAGQSFILTLPFVIG